MMTRRISGIRTRYVFETALSVGESERLGAGFSTLTYSTNEITAGIKHLAATYNVMSDGAKHGPKYSATQRLSGSAANRFFQRIDGRGEGKVANLCLHRSLL